MQQTVQQHRLGHKVWQLLAAPSHASDQGLQRCNRLILENLLPGQLASRRPSEDRWLIRTGEISDWKAFAARLVCDSKPAEDPLRAFWQLLPEPARAVVRQAQAGAGRLEDRDVVVAAINQVLSGQPLLLLRPIHLFFQERKNWQKAAALQDFLPNHERWTPFAFERFTRAFHRLIVEAAFPESLGRTRPPSGPPVIVAYRSRAEFLGEIGLLENRPRSATCVAYNHPENDPRREVGPVHLVRISRELFEELRAGNADFSRRVDEVRTSRKADSRRRLEAVSAGQSYKPVVSEQAGNLGLVQGQKLMLIDLERCTRCDECVHACVATHDDGRSRLFLDGPRFENFLVPTTCRSCLDPVCMIGCPVASIHRGGVGEIVIEDWCIGCGLCARQCPYGSIQMHALGIIPEGSFGWRFLPATRVGSARWYVPGHGDHDWAVDHAPLRFDRVFQDMLNDHGAPAEPGQPLCLRYGFQYRPRGMPAGSQARLEVQSTDQAIDSVKIWLNGREITTTERAKRGRREFPIAEPDKVLHTGWNLLAVQVTPATFSDEPFFDLGFYEARKLAEDITEKEVTQQAVVCDLCQSLPAGPACVRACPHDAALRIDARSQFPS
jgi:Fe-S-cluster-containing hydrogenase component 2